MPKTHVTIADSVMSRIKRDHIGMKPKWYFIFGSVLTIAGLVGTAIVLIFLVSLISFSLRTHGPMGEIRYQNLLSSFPWWAPVLAFVGLMVGIRLLKKFDFSYRKNFLLIFLACFVSIIISGWLLDYLGIDQLWSGKGMMRNFYRQYDGGRGNGDGWKNFRGNDRPHRGLFYTPDQ
jgi:uncharacterized membrane protein